MGKSNDILIYAYDRGYRVDVTGDVISFTGRKLTPRICTTGYYIISIRVPWEIFSVKFKVHRLAGYQKYKDKIFEKGMQVRHKDNNKLNNSLENILIGTQSQNMMDIPKEIRLAHAIDTSNHIRKFSDEKMAEMLYFYEETKSYKQVMEKYNISSKGTLHYMLNNTYVTTK